MKPLFVRELSDPERHALQAGLRSSDGFTVRRCPILLASARGDTAPVIAQAVGRSPQAVRNVLPAFERRGLAVVTMQSRRPHTAAKVFDAERSRQLKALLHQSPRQFGKARSTWTLALAAAVCAEHGITAERVSYETIRDALKRLGVGWRRAKTWITRPDPPYALQKTGATAWSALRPATPTGWWAMPTRSGGAAWPSRPCTPGARRCGCTPKRGPRTMPNPRLWPATGCCAPTRIGCCCALSKAAQSAASPPPFWPGGPAGSPRRASACGGWCGTMPPGTSAERCRRGVGRITARW